DANLTSTATVKMKVVDVSDNDGPVAAQEVTIDTTPPTTTVDITSITDDTGSNTNDFITNDNDGLTIGATLSAGLASDEALMYSNDNGLTWSDITADVAGTTVTHTDANLTSTNTIQMKVVDLAGNDGTVNTQLVTIDTTPPLAPTAVTITEDTNNDGILNGTELDGNVDVQIDLPAGVEA
ncbi:hypothetical protein, partial [Poseidonibacter antarcticus]|uniref:hypothetical protein n=1 Tax=Poseidonibacter antarcticus TaxID=2478538 RepID=UPI0013CEDF4F